MALYTAQYRYSGPDRMDVTAKANSMFSPPWKLVGPYKNAEAKASLATDKVVAESIMREAKLLYKEAYIKHLAENINKHIKEDYMNTMLLLKYMVESDFTFVCFCNVKKTGFCHRILAAEYMRDTYGIEYKGEREL